MLHDIFVVSDLRQQQQQEGLFLSRLLPEEPHEQQLGEPHKPQQDEPQEPQQEERQQQQDEQQQLQPRFLKRIAGFKMSSESSMDKRPRPGRGLGRPLLVYQALGIPVLRSYVVER